jgi:UDP:flavonoid glycosyltransferase YjiC (YdhE family)
VAIYDRDMDGGRGQAGQGLGVGRVIGPAERDAAAIRAAARTVLGDPRYRQRARHMHGQICALPPATAAVTALEQLAGNHARHRNCAAEP